MKKIIHSLTAAMLCIVAAPAFAQCSDCSSGACVPACQMPYLKTAQRRASQYNWHGNFNHSAYGQPVALVVPPTANLQTNWSWGAPSSRISRIDHQFGRNYPGPGPFGGGFRNTPVWPADTAQFGVYYARGPWYPIQR